MLCIYSPNLYSFAGTMRLKKKIIRGIFLPVFILLIFAGFENPVIADDFLGIPAAYKGRFRPVEVYSKLWLNDLYHHQTIKKEHLKSFSAINSSAEDLILKMNFLGRSPWDDAPIFWVHLAETKALLGLNLRQDHFSYNQLHQAIFENKKTNLEIVTRLILFHVYKALQDSSQPLQKVELASLAPGLWVAFIQDDLVVAAAPKSPPWDRLKPGMVLSSERHIPADFVNKHRLSAEEIVSLFNSLQLYLRIRSPDSLNAEFQETFLKLNDLPPKEIARLLEDAHPLKQRLVQSGPLLHVLPGKTGRGVWLPLNALNIQTYDAKTNAIIPVPNFTLFSNELFQQLQSLYLELKEKFSSSATDEDIHLTANRLAALLKEGYQPLAGLPYEKGSGNVLKYPSLEQIYVEQIYYRYPFIPFTIFLYGTACLCFFLGISQKNRVWEKWGMRMAAAAFGLHTLILGIRCFILQRPPVSNMFETVVYVPWIGMIIGFFLHFFLKIRFILFASSFASLLLLALLQAADINSHLENVQAVLNSQYWLIIHVMLVVGSYGAFILSGILGHAYLLGIFAWHEKFESKLLIAKMILQTMYIGVAMLVAGTILGGVWAAESWGRFWDWDPKESWAFISICIYLIWIHAYNFRIIHDFGLAVGSILGLTAISFTWYGVNYILGTGLHSYGFGNGGEGYYYLYLLGETIFLGCSFLARKGLISKNKL